MENTISFGWNKKTHSFITKQAFNKASKKVAIPLEKKVLKTYSKMPDIDQINNLNEWHFFDPIKNYMTNEKNADILFQKHIKKALKRWEENKPDKAAKNLGRALHYLQDIFMPLHAQKLTATEKLAQLKTHTSFEDKAQIVQKEILDTTKELNINEQLDFNEFIENIIKDKALISRKRIKNALSNDIVIISETIERSLQEAFETSSELLFRIGKLFTT